MQDISSLNIGDRLRKSNKIAFEEGYFCPILRSCIGYNVWDISTGCENLSLSLVYYEQWIIKNTEEIIRGVGSDISYHYTRHYSVLSSSSLCLVWCSSFTIFIKTMNLLGSPWRVVLPSQQGFITIFKIPVMFYDSEWPFILVSMWWISNLWMCTEIMAYIAIYV